MKPRLTWLPLALALVASPFLRAAASSPVTAEEVLLPFVQREELGGAVALVADREKVLSVVTVGYADIAAKKPMAPDTLFWIASQ